MQKRILWIIIFLLSFLSKASLSDQNPATPVLTLNGIEDFIRTNDIRSVEQLLSALPKSYLDHYTLMFQSRSLQSASFSNPRAIVFGTNGKLIMSFNGSPEQTGYYAIEAIEFNDLTKSFQMEEIAFPEPGDPSAHGAQFSKRNPDKCLKCHTANTHPIWDAPPLWPGAYGEAYHEKLSKAESDGLYSYLQQQASHPRYRFLTNTHPYTDESTFYPNRHNVYNGVEVEAPNAQLTTLLTKLNVEKIIHQVSSQPQFNQYQYALLASVSPACQAVINYLPREWTIQAQQYYADFRQHDNEEMHRQLQKKSSQRVGGNTGLADVDKSKSLLDFRFVAESGLAINTSEWGLAIEKNAADFSAFEPVNALLEQRLVSIVKSRDPELMNVYYYRNYPDNNKYCAYLEKQSVAQLKNSGYALQPILAKGSSLAGIDGRDAQKVQTILTICISCHTTGVAPAIPFDDVPRLTGKLKLPYSKRGPLLNEILYRISMEAGAKRMPPTINLTDSEVQLLTTYFSTLAQSSPP